MGTGQGNACGQSLVGGLHRCGHPGGKGRIMRSASDLYEQKVQGKFPDDYRKALHRERMVLHGLSQKGWDGQTKIPKPLLVKYGLAESFGK